MNIYAYLYDSVGFDKEIKIEDVDLTSLKENQLLWINILHRAEADINLVARYLKLESLPLKNILKTNQRPTVNKFEMFYHFFVAAVGETEGGRLKRVPIDYLIGKNFVITIHDGVVDYLQEFRDLEKGETHLGELDAESFLATLLDLHIVTYFRALEKIEDLVDQLDVEILKKDLNDNDFLKETVRLKSDVARLRRWLLPHREVFYALARPDFTPISESDSSEDFQLLLQHFDNSVDAVESARDTVLSLFDLYTTREAHRMNNFIKRLTFVTLLVGSLGAIAGVWGMNFEVEYFRSAETGFWLTIGGMGAFVLISIVLAKLFRWL